MPTARVLPAWTMESNMSASFCVNAWICAPQATDRDLESFCERLDMHLSGNRP